MDSLAILLFLAVLPVILILLFIYNKDKDKEPIKLLIILFTSGIASCFLVISVSSFLKPFLPFMNMSLEKMDFINTLLYAFIGVALIEETCKWIMLYFFGYNSKDFDELYDIIVYAVFVSLGFACFENLLYVMENSSIMVAVMRAISAVPGHACDAIFMGYYLSIAKQFHYKERYDLEKKNIILSIVIPTILHGIYDFCLMSGLIILILAFIVFVIFLYIISIGKIKEMSIANKKIKFKNKYCGICGTKVTGPFCSNCGARQE